VVISVLIRYRHEPVLGRPCTTAAACMIPRFSARSRAAGSQEGVQGGDVFLEIATSGSTTFSPPLLAAMAVVKNPLATTISVRLMRRAAVLEFEGKSCRLKKAASRIALNAAIGPIRLSCLRAV